MYYVTYIRLYIGGHLLLKDATNAMEEYVNNIQPSDESRKSPPAVPWFTTEDLLVEGITDYNSGSKGNDNNTADSSSNNNDDTTRPFHCRENTLEACESLENEVNKINEMLSEDSSHLLRKAQSAYMKCNNNNNNN